jgi:hypothetical protein
VLDAADDAHDLRETRVELGVLELEARAERVARRKTREASVWSTMATRAEREPSVEAKARPERTGTPSVRKYAASTQRVCAPGVSARSRTGRPATRKSLRTFMPESGSTLTAAASTAPGSAASRSTARR